MKNLVIKIQLKYYLNIVILKNCLKFYRDNLIDNFISTNFIFYSKVK